MNLFDRCSDRNLSPELKWMNEPGSWAFGENGALEIAAPPKSDFFIDPSGQSVRSSAPFLYAMKRGDFDMVTRVGVEMKAPYDSGCLMVMSDDGHWAKLCFEFYESTPTIISVVTNNHSDDCISCKAEASKPYLRIKRAGNCFTFYYSADGQKWETIRYFGLDCEEEIRIGVVAQSPTGEGCRVTFEHLVVT
ncbi:DUF1349 domain-containing protein [Cohnella sp. CFH 77786]|uniref:DUF1349 domain-containing protein n=1 Tax=Cohnella sp. CFH 77786 TaxID=2662265 RepID=UPI001C60F183|nr:DUF1349 domain-containing protein [Cohnella sp. CFH 77786]MBW5448597.1 DUF1349 domain-containing protein [Cohnella sp. CFH 77786]